MLIRRIFSTYSFLAIGLGLNYLFGIYVARIIGPDEFGLYVLCLSIFNIAAIAANSELDKAAIKFIPMNIDVEEHKAAILFIGFITSLTTITILVVTIWFAPIEGKYTLLIFTVCIPLFVWLSIGLAFLQARHITSKRLFIKYVVEPISKIFIFCIAIIAIEDTYNYTSAHAATALLTALSISNITNILMFKDKVAFKVYALKKFYVLKVTKYLTPLFVSNLIGIIASKSDILIIGMVLSSFETGLYGAAFQTAAMFAIILQGLEMVFAPIFSEIIAKGNFLDLATNYQRSLRLSLLLAGPLVVFIVGNPNLVMKMYGDGYLEGSNVLAILSINFLVILATGSANLLLILSGYTRSVLFFNIILFFSNIIVIYTSTSYFGLLGAALGLTLSTAVVNIARMIWVYQRLGVQPYSVSTIKFLAVIISSIVGQTLIGSSPHGPETLLLPIITFALCVLSLPKDDKTLVNQLSITRGAQ